MNPMANTNSLTKSVLGVLRIRGVYCWRQNNNAVFDPTKRIFRARSTVKGVPDILGIAADGRFVGVEIKSARDRVTKEQAAFLSEVNKRGGVGAVVRNVEDITNLMKRL